MVLKLYMLESPGGFDKTQIAEPYTGGSHSVDLIEGLRICSSSMFPNEPAAAPGTTLKEPRV